MVKKIKLTFIILHLCAFSLFAQTGGGKLCIKSPNQGGRIITPNEIFERRLQDIGIEINTPHTFYCIDSLRDFRKESNFNHFALPHRRWFQSKDLNCILMVSLPLMYIKEDSIKDSWRKERYARKQYNDGKSNDEPRQMFNADTVTSFTVLLKDFDSGLLLNSIKKERKFRKMYPLCKVLQIQKQNREYVYICCFFNKNGIERAKEYMKELAQLIWYQPIAF